MKKNVRVGMLLDELTRNPCRLFDANHFCSKFDIAKSSLSEDIHIVNEILTEGGSGHIETTSGVGGGIRFVPGISGEQIAELQQELITSLTDPSRILGGGFLYTADVMFNGRVVHGMARIFAQEFYSAGADYIVTIETKGIGLALQTAFLLDLPLVVIRREARYSEGSTVSINYFSGSNDRIQKMSIAKRAVEPGKRAVVIDDFMRGGGSLKGIVDILGEFDVETVGIGVALGSRLPERKKVDSFTPILIIGNIDEEHKTITISPNTALQTTGIRTEQEPQ